jgi:CheY-like chemotaxis protein/anti-sigma regulatory factor (Ser/Thr protein kinase)
VLELKKGLEVIERASLDGAETVRRIQEFARRRDDDKYFTTVDINEIIENSIDFTKVKWKDNAESKGIKIAIQKGFSTLPTTTGSATELREVFTNIINNAVDAMPQGGAVKIKTYMEDNHILIKIEDTGVGISKAIRDRVFDPFFTTKGPQSSGLGMSVSYGIIDRHRGIMAINSAEGEGTTFTIKLPISEKAVKEEKEEPVLNEQKKARILVVEDEETVSDLLSAILTEGGHEVETASDGSKGIQLFQKKEFDLVFTDLGMPGMSGWQVAEKIKSINKTVPVALITGWNVEQKESEMRERGVDLIAYKPFEVKQVFKLVQEGMILKDRFKAA